MFTGLIKDIGIVKSITKNAEGCEFLIETKLASEIAIDDSVATNGVCLTATEVGANYYKAQAVHITLEKTTLGKLGLGSKVNLELALRPMDRLGGYLVQGHVNGMATLNGLKQRGNNWELSFRPDPKLTRYMIKEGSICIDGISLTIADINDTQFMVTIIPHTYDNTHLHTKKIGDLVNIEVDMMAKYLENFMLHDKKFSLENWFKGNANA